MLRVGGVGDADGKGRHTTTSRQLVVLPGGALLIDTPGMRELQPWGDESAVAAAFDDIAGRPTAGSWIARTAASRTAPFGRPWRPVASTRIAWRTFSGSGASWRSKHGSTTRQQPQN